MHTQKSRILAVDYGMHRIGLSISDESKIIAVPLSTIKLKGTPEHAVDGLLKHIEELVNRKKYLIEEIVVGLPLKMDGTDSETTTIVRKFAALLQEKGGYPVKLFDERLTTVEAERMLIQANVARKDRAMVLDSLTAIILLQCYLQSKEITT